MEPVTAVDGGTAPQIAYFSMEIALEEGIPTYSGGLGVLAGDHLRAAADAGLPMVGVTLVYHEGYFEQQVDDQGRQSERPVRWSPADRLERLPHRVEVVIGGRRVQVGAWRKLVTGVTGHHVPVYLLDTALADNDARDQAITDRLYGGDAELRLSQEIVLGMGGVAMLAELGHHAGTFHMNEGHSALLTLAVAGEGFAEGRGDWRGVRDRCVFTTHTPVPAGHDRFDRALVQRVLGAPWYERLERLGLLDDGELNMTVLALAGSRRSNAVSLRHREVSRALFPGKEVDAITNGVHAATWVADSMADLFDAHLPSWRRENAVLHYALGLPLEEVRAAHAEAKWAMVTEVARRTGVRLDPDVLTLGVARRATAYKRTDLVLSDPARLRRLVDEVGPLQLVFAGKAHPRDQQGKRMIRHVVAAGHALRDAVEVVFVEGYSLDLARVLCAGVDVWCNTPVRAHEASGTSGMKAALNGVPSLSILDGWWIEGHWEGVTGWSIGEWARSAEEGGPLPHALGRGLAAEGSRSLEDHADATSFYDKLETRVAPSYYRQPDQFAAVMRNAIALNGSFFTAERMVREYATTSYQTPRGTADPADRGFAPS